MRNASAPVRRLSVRRLSVDGVVRLHGPGRSEVALAIVSADGGRWPYDALAEIFRQQGLILIEPPSRHRSSGVAHLRALCAPVRWGGDGGQGVLIWAAWLVSTGQKGSDPFSLSVFRFRHTSYLEPKERLEKLRREFALARLL